MCLCVWEICYMTFRIISCPVVYAGAWTCVCVGVNACIYCMCLGLACSVTFHHFPPPPPPPPVTTYIYPTGGLANSRPRHHEYFSPDPLTAPTAPSIPLITHLDILVATTKCLRNACLISYSFMSPNAMGIYLHVCMQGKMRCVHRFWPPPPMKNMKT